MEEAYGEEAEEGSGNAGGRDVDGDAHRREKKPADTFVLPDMGPCEQILLRAGDVVFKHSTLPHCGAPHFGSDIRYMLYYRLRHRDYAAMVAAASFKDDPWCDLSPEVRKIAAEIFEAHSTHA